MVCSDSPPESAPPSCSTAAPFSSAKRIHQSFMLRRARHHGAGVVLLPIPPPFGILPDSRKLRRMSIKSTPTANGTNGQLSPDALDVQRDFRDVSVVADDLDGIMAFSVYSNRAFYAFDVHRDKSSTLSKRKCEVQSCVLRLSYEKSSCPNNSTLIHRLRDRDCSTQQS